MKVAGFVLTGGRSTRMGRDKALLPVGSETLCERIASVIHEVAERVILIGHPERYGHLKYTCVEDLKPGLGPLSGLETALNLGLADLNVISSCDIFNLKADWLRALLITAEERNAACVVAQDQGGHLQPLCAVYRIQCLPAISSAIQANRLRAMDLLKELNAIPIPVDDHILNLNTPQEYDEIVNAHRRN